MIFKYFLLGLIADICNLRTIKFKASLGCMSWRPKWLYSQTLSQSNERRRGEGEEGCFKFIFNISSHKQQEVSFHRTVVPPNPDRFCKILSKHPTR